MVVTTAQPNEHNAAAAVGVNLTGNKVGEGKLCRKPSSVNSDQAALEWTFALSGRGSDHW